jgi:hypothetical protein
MKKTLSFVLALLMILSVTAYASEEEFTPEPGAHWEEVSSGVKVWKNSIGSKWVHAWIEIRNTGTEPLYLSSASMDLEDAAGDFAQTLKSVNPFPQILMPGEVGVYDECTLADDDLPMKDLTVTSRLDVEPAKRSCIRYDVSSLKIKTDKYKQTKATGRVENGTDETADGMIYVAVLCYNKKGAYLGTLWTIVTDDIPAGDRQGFETMGADFEVKAEDVASTVAYAYPYQFQF